MKTQFFRLRIYITVFLAVLIFGTAGFFFLENVAVTDAFYFSIVTISTVGYGDIHPVTAPGKALAVVLIILGTGTFLGVIASVTEIFLSRREQRARSDKLHIVIGLFFSEIGSKLISSVTSCDPNLCNIKDNLCIQKDWSDKEFGEIEELLKKYKFSVDIDRIDFDQYRNLFTENKSLIIRLLEHPALLEHESFTELLQACFHFYEELVYRMKDGDLTGDDKDHLKVDILRVYNHLVKEWLGYMKYLKQKYPYLYIYAVRTNPFSK